jgi:putative hydrolase of the HAD superfamily
MIEGLRNIIFDLGGVILNIDYQRPIHAFEKLGIRHADKIYSQAEQTALFDALETGKIGEAEFIAGLKGLSGIAVSETQLIEAWNSILLDFPLRRLQILQQLQLHFNTFLCSNTNEIHEKAFNQILQQTCGYPSLAVFFDKVYLSHRVGLRKPDPAIFQKILDDNQLKPEETLFIDDSFQHIQSADKLGIRTIHLTDGMTMEKDIFKPKA